MVNFERALGQFLFERWRSRPVREAAPSNRGQPRVIRETGGSAVRVHGVADAPRVVPKPRPATPRPMAKPASKPATPRVEAKPMPVAPRVAAAVPPQPSQPASKPAPRAVISEAEYQKRLDAIDARYDVMR